MYSVESALVTGCHSGLGGTGDVAILTASNRMELMPFAQISTRIEKGDQYSTRDRGPWAGKKQLKVFESLVKENAEEA